MLVKIAVTKSDIKKGRTCQKQNEKAQGFQNANLSSVSCPIYQALVRRKYKIRSVGFSSIRFFNEYKHTPLPTKAMEFIGKFDSGERVNPFSFSVDIPKKFHPTKK